MMLCIDTIDTEYIYCVTFSNRMIHTLEPEEIKVYYL